MVNYLIRKLFDTNNPFKGKIRHYMLQVISLKTCVGHKKVFSASITEAGGNTHMVIF